MAETVREVLPHVPDDVIFQVQFQLQHYTEWYWLFWRIVEIHFAPYEQGC